MLFLDKFEELTSVELSEGDVFHDIALSVVSKMLVVPRRIHTHDQLHQNIIYIAHNRKLCAADGCDICSR